MTTLPMTFDPSLVEGRSYAHESDTFVLTYGCTPRDVVRTAAGEAEFVDQFGVTAATYALFLDCWDVWLYSEEAEMAM